MRRRPLSDLGLGRRRGNLFATFFTRNPNVSRCFDPQFHGTVRRSNNRNCDVVAQLDRLRHFASENQHRMNLSRLAAISGRATKKAPRRSTRESFTVHSRDRDNIKVMNRVKTKFALFINLLSLNQSVKSSPLHRLNFTDSI